MPHKKQQDPFLVRNKYYRIMNAKWRADERSLIFLSMSEITVHIGDYGQPICVEVNGASWQH
jgi:hypothetical protein